MPRPTGYQAPATDACAKLLQMLGVGVASGTFQLGAGVLSDSGRIGYRARAVDRPMSTAVGQEQQAVQGQHPAVDPC